MPTNQTNGLIINLVFSLWQWKYFHWIFDFNCLVIDENGELCRVKIGKINISSHLRLFNGAGMCVWSVVYAHVCVCVVSVRFLLYRIWIWIWIRIHLIWDWRSEANIVDCRLSIYKFKYNVGEIEPAIAVMKSNFIEKNEIHFHFQGITWCAFVQCVFVIWWVTGDWYKRILSLFRLYTHLMVIIIYLEMMKV